MLANEIKNAFGSSTDLIVRPFIIDNREITLVMSEVLGSSSYVNDFILRRLLTIKFQSDDIGSQLLNFIPTNNGKILNKLSDMTDYICMGFALILFSDNESEKAIAIEARATIDRGIPIVNNEASITGSKDAFNENFNTNIGLIRRRIRDCNLYVDGMFVGKSSKTKIGILYMNNIAIKKNVDKIKNKLKKINVDGILDTGNLKSYLDSKTNFFFPTITSTERPDKVAQALLEGKIAIVSDNSPFVLITPTFFVDYLHTSDDYYEKAINTSFIRIVRFLAFLIAIFTPALYIALTTHNQDILPLSLFLNFMEQRDTVPFSALIEALFMSISFEILRESDIRKPASMGTSVSILGGLILGDAAVSAGIISPIMIIVISISAISGLAFSSVEMIYALRWWRFIMLFLAMFFGLFGIFVGFIILLASLVTTSSESLPYLAPFSPFIKEEIKDTIIKGNHKKTRFRNPLLTKNRIREKSE